jgi:hypothetical protein
MLNRFSALVLWSALVLAPAARASEGMFSYTYTTDTTPAGNWEYEQKQILRTGKARGSYTAVDLRNEMEYGITDRLQGSLYLNSSYNYMKNQYDPDNVSMNLPDRNEFNVNGVSMEFLYRILSPYTDGIGLAAYLEPELSVRDHMTGQDQIERALEGRIILHKTFLDDTLVTAFNLMFEPEWEKDDGLTTKELWLQASLGATYRVAAGWFVGLELRNHREFPKMDMRNQEHSAYFLGPTLHYATQTAWFTLTVLPQIKGTPAQLGRGADGMMISDPSRHLGQHEKLEVAFAFGIPFGVEKQN